MGLKTEIRPIPFDEVGTFEEVGQCGTAAVISPVGRIDDLDKNESYSFSKDGEPGPVSKKLYHKLRAIQYGDEPDPYGWVTILE
jgi:branched-chain amino acid aminotransferase